MYDFVIEKNDVRRVIENVTQSSIRVTNDDFDKYDEQICDENGNATISITFFDSSFRVETNDDEYVVFDSFDNVVDSIELCDDDDSIVRMIENAIR